MYDYKYLRNMLWSVGDNSTTLQPFIKMKHGPYLVRDAIVNGEKVHISESELKEHVLKEFTHLLQIEYNAYKNNYYPNTDCKTGVISKPKLISWDTLENIEIPVSDNSEFTRIEEKIVLYQSLDNLKKHNALYHMIIVLYFFSDMNYSDIAQVTGFTRQTVSKKMSSALEALRNLIEGTHNI